MLSADLRNILDETIKTGPKASRGWFEDVEQLRLEIRPGRLEPDWVSIHFLCELTAEEEANWRTMEKRIKALFEQHSIAFGLLRFDHLPNIKAVDYRTWVPLPIPRLARQYHW